VPHLTAPTPPPFSNRLLLQKPEKVCSLCGFLRLAYEYDSNFW